MRYSPLGRTDLEVSRICLGTMTFGQQNDEAQAHAQLDQALAAGVNFIDTAEMYPFPATERTCGDTERFVGRWMAARGNRDQVLLASKVAGPAEGWLTWIRGGTARLDRTSIRAALEASLKRLRTDYLDLYQVHWPDRNTNYFGRLGYRHEPDPREVPVAETLGALDELVREGKVRHVGISNETPWGAMRYLGLAEREGLARVASIQNPYCLLNRSFEVGLAEVAHREDLGLLAYSPLGFGVLSGKYLGGAMPAGSRLDRYPRYRRYSNPAGVAATEAYAALAREHGLTLAGMALAYVNTRPFLTSTIVGATTPAQLAENLASIDVALDEAVLTGIEAIHERHANPCP